MLPTADDLSPMFAAADAYAEAAQLRSSKISEVRARGIGVHETYEQVEVKAADKVRDARRNEYTAVKETLVAKFPGLFIDIGHSGMNCEDMPGFRKHVARQLAVYALGVWQESVKETMEPLRLRMVKVAEVEPLRMKVGDYGMGGDNVWKVVKLLKNHAKGLTFLPKCNTPLRMKDKVKPMTEADAMLLVSLVESKNKFLADNGLSL